MNTAEESGAGEGARLSPQDLFLSLFSPLTHSLFHTLTVICSPPVADV